MDFIYSDTKSSGNEHVPTMAAKHRQILFPFLVLFVCLFLCFFVFETGSWSVAQDKCSGVSIPQFNLKLLASSDDPPASAPHSARITGLSRLILKINNCGLFPNFYL